jgi:hypothetical protein
MTDHAESENPLATCKPPFPAALAVGAALAVLTWGALPYLPGQIDDAFIVFAYAHRVIEHGEVAWNTGVRVEGYSSPLHLLLMVAGAAAGLDLSVFARVVSFCAAATTLAVLAGERFRGGRHWLLLLLAAWQPFQHWSVAALETSIATLLAVISWPLVLGSRAAWANGCVVLALFSLTRPEGAAWLVAGVFLRLRHASGLGVAEGRVAAALVALAMYHVARVLYFGEVFPTPWLVKIVAIDDSAAGVRELGFELLSAAPLVALTLALRRQIPVAAWLPLALQAGLLVRAGGDWMGNARFLLPGVVASAAAAFSAGSQRPVARWVAWPLLPFAALTFAWEPARMQGVGPAWRDPWFLARPWAALRTPWSVPLLDEVAFLVPRIPEGAGVEMSDVGLPGNLEDIRVWDGAGLTDRVVADIIAGTDGGMSAPLKARFDDPTAIWCLRYGIAEDGSDPADRWMMDLFPDVASRPNPRGLFWRCREGGAPSGAVVLSRWKSLLSRFPRQDLIRWHYARALLEAGDLTEATDTARGATWIGADADGWLAFAPGDAADAYAPARGWPLYANGSRTSAPLPQAFWAFHLASLDVDDPGTDGAQAILRWEPDCGERLSVAVRKRQAVALPPCDHSPRALAIEFLNDEWRPPFDRNLYVTLLPLAASTPAR